MLLKPPFSSLHVGENLHVIDVTELLGSVDVNEHGHWSLLSLQRPLARWIKHPLDVTVQGSHGPNPRKHRRPAFRRNQDQRLRGRLPLRSPRARPSKAS